MTLRIGTRSSPLALLQAQSGAVELVAPMGCEFELVPFSSPGDRDHSADLRTAPGDFFTRDLDDALRNGTLDCAIHSAKDLPDPLSDDLDWFWLPTVEDSRDAIVCRVGEAMPENPVIGISSERRNIWAKQHFAASEFRPIRGTIEKRLAQLDAGDFDLLIMAVAALNRLGLANRITEVIPPEELPPPEGQGALAVTFLKGNALMTRLRQAFVYPVVLAGAGPGAPELLTMGVAEALQNCDMCLYDALGFKALHTLLPKYARAIFVGKRLGEHSVKQAEISQMIADEVRKGRRVVRLKGGDPGIFGRLAEEVDTLAGLRLPFRVIPGVSSVAAATTGTGLLATRRGLSRGFVTATPRTAHGMDPMIASDAAKSELAHIFLMSASESDVICETLMRDGMSPDTPAAIVFDASLPTQTVLHGTLATLPEKIAAFASDFDGHPPPGIILAGKVFDAQYRYPMDGLLGGKRILLTCTGTLMQLAKDAVLRYNGIPIPLPMIELREISGAADELKLALPHNDWVICASPSAAHFVLENAADLRRLPKVMVSGKGTGDVFRNAGIIPDAEPPSNAGNDSLAALISTHLCATDRVLRICSDVASPTPAKALNAVGCVWNALIFAINTPREHAVVPSFDVIYFASGSAVTAFKRNFPDFTFAQQQYIVVIGEPTRQALLKIYPQIDGKQVICPSEASTTAAFAAFGRVCLSLDRT